MASRPHFRQTLRLSQEDAPQARSKVEAALRPYFVTPTFARTDDLKQRRDRDLSGRRRSSPDPI